MEKPLLYLALVLAIAVFGWVRLRKPAARPEPPPIEQIDAFMQYCAGEAVDISRGMGIQLDYSEASIMRADEALEKIRQEYLQRKSDQGVSGLATMFGAYVGEVVRRSEPKAYWKKDHPAIGENTYPLFWGIGDASIFPVGWCHKRILNGEEDNITVKLKLSRMQRQKTY